MQGVSPLGAGGPEALMHFLKPISWCGLRGAEVVGQGPPSLSYFQGLPEPKLGKWQRPVLLGGPVTTSTSSI